MRPVASRSCGRLCFAALHRLLSLALPPFLTPCTRAQLIPHLDFRCTLALNKLASSSNLLAKSSKDLVARHLAFAGAEVRRGAALTRCVVSRVDA